MRARFRPIPTIPGDAATTSWYDCGDFATLDNRTWILDLADDRLGDDTGDDGLIVTRGGPTASVAIPVPLVGLWPLLLMAFMLLLIGLRVRSSRSL